jgi:quinol monooxygenase YgiN
MREVNVKYFFALAVTAWLGLCCDLALAGGPRVVVFLKAKPGTEQTLLDNTKHWMVEVRKVPGLERVDVNIQNDDPSTLVLYYDWRSKEDEEAYRKSDLYKQAIDALEPLVGERHLVRATNVD